jgi:hypothetical protein
VASNMSTVAISETHLKEGVSQSECWCALAVSLRQDVQAGLNDTIEVTAKYVRVELGHGTWWAETTPDLQAFMKRFDATEDHPRRLPALIARAKEGKLAFQLTWHEGEPPEDDDG